MSEQMDHLINRYEEDISAHDCREWEDQLVKAGVRKLPSLLVNNVKKTTVKRELIDVDLVRGSTFPKPKTQQGLPSTLWFSLVASLLFPLKSSWWVRKTNLLVYLVGLVIFCSTGLNLLLYHLILCPSDQDSEYCQKVTPQELYEPCVLFIVLAFLQCNIVSPTKANLEIFRAASKRVSSTTSRRQSRHLGSRSGSGGRRRRKSNSKGHLLDCWQERITSGSEENEDDGHHGGDDEPLAPSHTSCHSSESESEREVPGRKRGMFSTSHSDHESEGGSRDSGLPQACHVVSQIGCTLWSSSEAPSKVHLSPLEIGNAIFERSKSLPDSLGYAVAGLVFSITLALIPLVFKAGDLARLGTKVLASSTLMQAVINEPQLVLEPNNSHQCWLDENEMSPSSTIYFSIIITAAVNRVVLTTSLFFLFAVAEREFKRRFLTAKLFSHITSTRRSMKSKIPHFRLYKVRNIKAWLCVRSFLRRRGPQRSIDCIVSGAFLITIVNVAYLCYQLLKDDDVNPEVSVANCEVVCWCGAIGIFLIRYMSLASKINNKYRNLSVLLTEQINLYLQMELKPHKKEQLLLANNVLKLSSDLLKELETPFKIHGLSANPFLYNVTKVLVLSAVSGVLSEMLGFKLKLYKVKIK